MITRLRIQNYKSISDLTLELGSKNLLMGLNGSGKTAVFDVLAGIRELVVEGEKCERVFPLSTLPRWISEDGASSHQVFELAMESGGRQYAYTMTLEHYWRQATVRVVKEELFHNGDIVFRFSNGRVETIAEEHAIQVPYPASFEHSALTTVPSNPFDTSAVQAFMESLGRVYAFRMEASHISGHSQSPSMKLARDLSNFTSWYRQAFLRDTGAGMQFLAVIREAIGGLEGMNIRDFGRGVAVLEAVFTTQIENGRREHARSAYKHTLDFNELSDGQRALIALYAFSYFLIREGSTLCIDEPDNFIALAEIQPWLNTALDLVDDNGGQLIIASHHPEFYNLLAPDHGIVLKREGAGPTIAERYRQDDESPLTPAERVAMGEVND